LHGLHHCTLRQDFCSQDFHRFGGQAHFFRHGLPS
jgi:hypothetical protein